MKIRLGVSIAAALTVGAIPVDAMTPLGPFIVFFEQGSVELSDMSLRVLDNTAAALLGREPAVRLVLEGSTDRSGSTRSNHALACRRARAVRDRLVELGLEQERLVLIGYGEAPGGTADVLSSSGPDGIPPGARRHVHMWVTGSSEVVDVPQRLRCT